MIKNIQINSKAILFLLSLLLISFVCIKSNTASFTHDESFTYNHYVHQSFMDIVSYADAISNNHIFNTLMMKGNELLFGSSEVVLRLHSILALAGYMFFCCCILIRLPSRTPIVFFLLLVANPYFIDFFALARGYAVAFCFMTGSFYFIMRWLQTNALVNLAAFNLCMLLTCYSHFSMVNFYLAAFFSINLILLLQTNYNARVPSKRKGQLLYVVKCTAINLAFMLLTTLLIWEPLRKISGLHLFDFGGKSDVVTDTIYSVIKSSFYDIQVAAPIILVLSWLAAASIAGMLFVWIWYVVRHGKDSFKNVQMLLFANCSLIGVLIVIILQHYVLQNDYFTGRFALFLYPLFMLNLIFCFNLLYSMQKLRPLYTAAPVVLGLLFLLNFLANVNVTHYLDWEYDMDTRKMITVLAKEHNDQPNKKMVLGVAWLYEPTANYYRQTMKLDWLEPIKRIDLQKTDDFLYDTEADIVEVRQKPFEVLFTSKMNAILVRNH